MNATALEQLACVQNERVYDITLSGINAWFEAKTVEPHVSVFYLCAKRVLSFLLDFNCNAIFELGAFIRHRSHKQ